jgi:16S rRNA (adenine1518-N6/adenine1519-N6)-dimethyltransferase
VNPDSPAEIRALLAERGLALKKRWGQNFLINRGARERLVALLDPIPGDTVWEIGPGLGSMTGLLLPRSAQVIAFEVDRGMCRYLTEIFGSRQSFALMPGDFLDTWKGALPVHGRPQRLLGNLPYRSASMMIADIIEGGLRPVSMVFTVQRELADRMESRPGKKSYSSFSVLCQTCFNVTGRGDLQPGSFYPVPDVVSSIVEMRPRDDAPEGSALRFLSILVRGLFSSRRKTIRNNLGSAWLAPVVSREAGLAALEKEGIDAGARAEELPPAAFVRLARALAGAGSTSGPIEVSSP